MQPWEKMGVSYLEFRMCARKRGVVTERDARNRARQQSQKTGESIEHYKCPFCKLWHSGHTLSQEKRIEAFLLEQEAEAIKEAMKRKGRFV
jgi:hypothetical protein